MPAHRSLRKRGTMKIALSKSRFSVAVFAVLAGSAASAQTFEQAPAAAGTTPSIQFHQQHNPQTRRARGSPRLTESLYYGQLLSYGDDGTPGNVSSPVVVGYGGWSQFQFLFAGKNALGQDRIYAVN